MQCVAAVQMNRCDEVSITAHFAARVNRFAQDLCVSDASGVV